MQNKLFSNIRRLTKGYFSKSEPQQMSMYPVIKQPAQIRSNHSSVTVAPLLRKSVEDSSDDAILEEAELYSNHGRPATAVKILLDLLYRNPSNLAAWSLLLSNYSSLGNAIQFEETARSFLKHLEYHEDSSLWVKIQALGRTLDKGNPLYIDHSGNTFVSPLLPGESKPYRPLGNILLGMGILTEHILQSCLDSFDPLKHGRFGGFLLSNRVITLAQLDQALLQQQVGLS